MKINEERREMVLLSMAASLFWRARVLAGRENREVELAGRPKCFWATVLKYWIKVALGAGGSSIMTPTSSRVMPSMTGILEARVEVKLRVGVVR